MNDLVLHCTLQREARRAQSQIPTFYGPPEFIQSNLTLDERTPDERNNVLHDCGCSGEMGCERLMKCDVVLYMDDLCPPKRCVSTITRHAALSKRDRPI